LPADLPRAGCHREPLIARLPRPLCVCLLLLDGPAVARTAERPFDATDIHSSRKGDTTSDDGHERRNGMETMRVNEPCPLAPWSLAVRSGAGV